MYVEFGLHIDCERYDEFEIPWIFQPPQKHNIKKKKKREKEKRYCATTESLKQTTFQARFIKHVLDVKT